MRLKLVTEGEADDADVEAKRSAESASVTETDKYHEY